MTQSQAFAPGTKIEDLNITAADCKLPGRRAQGLFSFVVDMSLESWKRLHQEATLSEGLICEIIWSGELGPGKMDAATGAYVERVLLDASALIKDLQQIMKLSCLVMEGTVPVHPANPAEARLVAAVIVFVASGAFARGDFFG